MAETVCCVLRLADEILFCATAIASVEVSVLALALARQLPHPPPQATNKQVIKAVVNVRACPLVHMAIRQIIFAKSFIGSIHSNLARADGEPLWCVHASRKRTLATPITHTYLLMVWT
jgi:hypothetical protein